MGRCSIFCNHPSASAESDAQKDAEAFCLGGCVAAADLHGSDKEQQGPNRLHNSKRGDGGEEGKPRNCQTDQRPYINGFAQARQAEKADQWIIGAETNQQKMIDIFLLVMQETMQLECTLPSKTIFCSINFHLKRDIYSRKIFIHMLMW